VAAGPGENDPAGPLPGRAAGPPDAARLAGTAVHLALEHWDFRDGASLRDRARAAAGTVLASEGHTLPEGRQAGAALREAVHAEVDEIVGGFLASPLPAEIAARAAAAPGLLREVPVIVRGGGKDRAGDDGAVVWLGAADLITREADGTWVVTDWKTGRLRGDPTVEAARHRDQLALYARALRVALGTEKVRAEIVFVRDGLAVPVETGEA
jgi:ATP-dependent exoDNAse (exonuclease V) beta subunit